MKKLLCLVAIAAIVQQVQAQDEGVITRKERIDRSSSVFLDLGPSFTLGKNIGDYRIGFSAETGFQKRLNRVLSIGPSISYLSFKYDPDATDDASRAFVEYNDAYDYWQGYTVELTGGDLSLISFAVNLKVNLVPVKDNSVISIYGFAKPFVSWVKRTEVRGTSTYWEGYDNGNGGVDWEIVDDTLPEWGPDDYPALAEESGVTGGIFVGPGIELFPARKASFFVQASFGYTFPINFVSTGSYDYTFESYFDEQFPMIKEGFPSVNIQVGLSVNF